MMKRTLFFLYINIILLNGCMDYPTLGTEVIGAGVPEIDPTVVEIVKDRKATSLRIRATVLKENGEVITERGFYYGTNPDPDEDDKKVYETDMEKRIGSYEMTLTGLENNTKYYIRPYAKNKIGIGKGPVHECITQEGVAGVHTTEPEMVWAASTRLGLKITYAGEGDVKQLGFHLYYKDNLEILRTAVFETTYPIPVVVNDSFKYVVTGLKPSTLYDVRAFVTNDFGTTIGNVQMFFTRDGRPIVGKTEIIDREYTESTLKSSATNGGDPTVQITERGFCWAIESEINDPNELNKTKKIVRCDLFDDFFEGIIQPLESEKTYLARAFATTDLDITVYGEIITVPSLKAIPSVETGEIKINLPGNADISGKITSIGESPIIASGICWSIDNQVPTLSDSVLSLPADYSGFFSGRLTRLKGSLTYYLRAFATNAKGTGYGEVVSFQTPFIFTYGLLPLTSEARFTNSVAYFAIDIDGELYIVGGDIGTKYTDEVWKYNIASNHWTGCLAFPGGPMKWQTGIPYGRGALIYGGFNGKGDEKPGIYYYNAPDNLWSYYDGRPDSAVVNRTVGYAYDNRVYYIGGINADTISQEVWSFHWATKTWQKKTDFPVKQYKGLAVMIGSVAYAGMGIGEDGECNKSLWISTDGANTWELKTTYPLFGNVLASVVCDQKLYVIDAFYDIHEYNPATDVWTKKSQIIDRLRTIHCIYAVSKKIYFGLPGNAMAIYDPAWDN